ncbi:MAG: hypothetical protein IKN55_10885 [Oscillospiraceae bacterium]|nr:hypothetical protein [Oscillospiraceae bacterium]
MNENQKKAKALMEDEAFVRACFAAENEAAVQKLFADNGVTVSTEEIELMKDMIGAVADGKISGEQLEKLTNGGELSEDELSEVAGGVIEIWQDGTRVLSKGEFRTGVAGVVITGLMIVGGTTYGILKGCGVDVEGGISSAASAVKDGVVTGATTAYGWVKDNITRW